jgi:hypothetical protein
MTHRTGIPGGVLLLALLCAFSFGAIVRVAFAADNNHVTCVSHGFWAGASSTDGSFFSRVYAGCGSTYRRCGITSSGALYGFQEAYDTTSVCNAWSMDFGSFTECHGGARDSNPGVFSEHTHNASDYCG